MAFRVCLLALAFLGHTGFWLYCFNRINAAGISRHSIKVIEKFIVLSWFVVLSVAILFYRGPIFDWLRLEQNATPGWLTVYGSLCVLFAIIVGPLWILTRFPLWFPPQNLKSTSTQLWNVAKECGSSIYQSRISQVASRIPLNEIGHVELSHKHIAIPSLAESKRSIKVAHISDIHLTGYMSNAFYDFALARILEQSPDFIVVSGDIIDYDEMLPQVRPILSKLAAPFGCYFVLGNHDRRISDPDGFRNMLTEMGWHDVAMQSVTFRMGEGRVCLVGNELPWFANCHSSWPARDTQPCPWELKLAVAHSPDQFPWAVQLGADLMLCGHTHGGHARFPLIGPIVAPSWYGSQYASGLFCRNNTVMHVSRGLSGVHPLRLWCVPEVSILELHGSQSS